MADPYVVRFAPDVEIQSGGDGRTVYGILVPWDAPARVYDSFGPTGKPAAYTEAVARGAFDAAIANPGRTKFLGHHNKQVNPLGRAEVLRNDTAGLYGEMRVSKTLAGDEVLELVRDGALDSFSVSFMPRRNESRGDVFYRLEADLPEASIVTFPAYAGALVGGVRSQDLPNPSIEQPGAGVGEPLAESSGSGDLAGLTVVRTGMTPNERARAIAIASLPRSYNP